jgi:hypothetical protein
MRYASGDPIDASDPQGLYTVNEPFARGKIDQAMSLIKSEAQKKSSGADACKCCDYFKERGIDLTQWASPGGPPYITVHPVPSLPPTDAKAYSQNRSPWWIINVRDTFFSEAAPWDLASLLLHEMGHLARHDTAKIEPNDFFEACKMGPLMPGKYR